MVRNEQLPEWQKKSPPQLPDPYTADNVPNSQKLNEKKRFLKVVEERGDSQKSVIAALTLLFLDSRGDCGASCLKLVPFVRKADAGLMGECKVPVLSLNPGFGRSAPDPGQARYASGRHERGWITARQTALRE
jgi:hypothetical protein